MLRAHCRHNPVWLQPLANDFARKLIALLRPVSSRVLTINSRYLLNVLAHAQ